MKIHSGKIAILSDNQLTKGSEIIGLISEGRTFRVFKARYGSKYVILKTPVIQDAMTVEILRREYELCCTLVHPCIVSTIGFEENSPVGPAIILEYIEGFALDEFIAHGASILQRKAVLMDILDGVDYLHHRGILHNDLKPDNIIVNSNGAARIIDFGLSLSTDSVYKGCVGGSYGYSAPEILNGKAPAGSASDIYSLGLIIRLLFGGSKYRFIVRRCSRINPEERFQSIAELRSAFTRHNLLPVAIIGVATIFAIILLGCIPTIERVSKRIQNKKVEEIIRNEIEIFYEPVFESIKKQEYMESAEVIRQKYVECYTHYLDSLEKAHPMQTDGIIPAEVVIAFDIVRSKCEILDSIIISLPSIKKGYSSFASAKQPNYGGRKTD